MEKYKLIPAGETLDKLWHLASSLGHLLTRQVLHEPHPSGSDHYHAPEPPHDPYWDEQEAIGQRMVDYARSQHGRPT